MLPTLAQLRAWDTDHLINAANYWTDTADQWEEVFIQLRNEAHPLPGVEPAATRYENGLQLTCRSLTAR